MDYLQREDNMADNKIDFTGCITTKDMLARVATYLVKHLEEKLNNSDIEVQTKTALLFLKALDGTEEFAENNKGLLNQIINYSHIKKSKKAKKHLDEKVIYFIKANDLVKVGITSNLPMRIYDLQNASPYKLELLITIGDATFKKERELHKRFQEYRVSGEWFIYNELIASYIDGIKNV